MKTILHSFVVLTCVGLASGMTLLLYVAFIAMHLSPAAWQILNWGIPTFSLTVAVIFAMLLSCLFHFTLKPKTPNTHEKQIS